MDTTTTLEVSPNTPDIKVFEPWGRFDSSQTEQFRKEVNDSVVKGAKIVLINLKNVTFIDSSGLGALVLILRSVRAAGGKLFLCSISEPVKVLFDLTSVRLVFDIFVNLEEFNNAFFSNQSLGSHY